MANFSYLPSEIMLDIFTRLPAELVLDCESVSKTWRNVLHHPSFSQMHSNLLLSNLDSAAAADSGKSSFIFRTNDRYNPLCYLEYDDEVSCHRVKKLNLNPPFKYYRLLGSSNGLICINGLPNCYTTTMSESTTAAYVAYICNPITRECITLPELDRSVYYRLVDSMSCGFGYVASTNEYKVVRIYTLWREREFAQIEVYTLGSGKGWRNAGKIDIDSGCIARRNAVFVNGFLYWDLGDGMTGAFDLADETFGRYSSEFTDAHLWGGVLGGHFSGTLYSEDRRSSDVWLLKKKEEDESLSWNKEFSLISMDPFTKSLALTSSGTVLCYSELKLHLYDLKSSSSKILEDFGRSISVSEAIPHINTLVSLKAFGEENTQTLGSSESATKEANGRDWQMNW